jgi:hypothetical protein
MKSTPHALAPADIVAEMISELVEPQNVGERLSSYIDPPKRLGCPASNPDRLCCLQTTPRLPRAAWKSLKSLGVSISACSGGYE